MQCLHIGTGSALLCLLLSTGATAQTGITWAPTLDGALADAAARNTIVVIALVAPGDRASRELLEQHYVDERLLELSQHTLNMLFTVRAGSSSADETTIRERFLGGRTDDWPLVPHHLFVRPGPDGKGELISSVAHGLRVGQLEWIWVDALEKVRPEFAWELGDRARAPERLLYGEASPDRGQAPPNTADVDETLKELKKSRGARAVRNLQRMVELLRSDDAEAIKYVESSLRNVNDGQKRLTLEGIGNASPAAWWRLCSEYLANRSEELREEAARALEQLAAKDSGGAIKKQWRKESDPAVKGRLLRAMAAAAPADRAVFQTLDKVLGKDKDASVRAQAAAAAEVLEDREAVNGLLVQALGDEDPTVRSAAAWAIAGRREQGLLQPLEAALQKEHDDEAKHWLKTAVDVVGDGDFREFRRFARDVLGDRERGRGGRGARGTGRAGGAGDPGDSGDGGDGSGDEGNGAGRARGGRRGGGQ